MNVLECEDLRVRFKGLDKEVFAVNGVSFNLRRGECLGIVGESGSGKSQTAIAVMGLLPGNGYAKGSVRLNGEEILNAPRKRMNQIRGKEIAMIFQDPMSALTPFIAIGKQMTEGLLKHNKISFDEARQKAIEYLALVGIPDPDQRFDQYPYELSGGMRQRVMIAQSMLCTPLVVVADEPTTALDVTTQSQILDIFRALKDKTDTSLVIITHDIGVVINLCDRVIVMYGGKAVEEGKTEEVFSNTRHPYTRALLSSVPRIDHDPSVEISSIPGQPPHFSVEPSKCPFLRRCSESTELCWREPPQQHRVSSTHMAVCHLLD